MHLRLKYWPFVPYIESWEPCGFTEAPYGPHAFNLNVLWHQEKGAWKEWVASTFTLPRNMVYPALLPMMYTPRLPVVDWTDARVDLNGIVRFAEGRNLVSAHVPSRFKRSLHLNVEKIMFCHRASWLKMVTLLTSVNGSYHFCGIQQTLLQFNLLGPELFFFNFSTLCI